MLHQYIQVSEAHGRYIVSHASTISTKTLSEVLSKRFPQYKFPEGKHQPAKEVIDNSKVAFHAHPAALLGMMSPLSKQCMTLPTGLRIM